MYMYALRGTKTDNEIDMVLNSLALEFILHIDEDLKAYLFDLLEEQEEEEDFCLTFFQDTESKQADNNMYDSWKAFDKPFDKFLNVLIMFVLGCSVVFSLFFSVYGTWCKPGQLGIM